MAGSDLRSVEEILNHTVDGQRLSDEDALTLLRDADLLELGQAANAVRNRMNDPKVVTYIVDRNINY
ncbi:MAG: dehypoxanthine futalosine cyclase, partial [Thermoanaerobaculia bacterium]|nr:dehypoxanthine futalosine cyclase [Thermoanaerobaculia bacterium]